MLEFDYMRLAMLTGVLVGVLAPVVGFFLVERRLSLMGDGIGHFAFAGVGLALFLGAPPVLVALGTSVGGAVAVETLRSRRVAADQALALMFYTALALGVVLSSAAGALNSGLFAFLFGAILTVTKHDVAIIAALALAALVLIALLYRVLLASALDEDAARVQGLPVSGLNIVVAALAGVTVAASIQAVGVLLIAALMVLPVMAARIVARSAMSTLVLAVVFGVASALGGLVVSWYLNLAPGGAIVLLAAAVYALVALAHTAWWRIAPGGRGTAGRRERDNDRCLRAHNGVAGLAPQHAHAEAHVHGPDCGHPTVWHGDHVDYVVDGRRHHVQDDHCHDHGALPEEER